MLWTALLCALAARGAAAEVAVRVQDAAGKPVEGAVVFLEGGAVSTAAADAVMDQIGMEFQPHVLVVRAGSRVRFPNHDKVQHEIYSFSKAKRFELPLAKDTAAEPVAFDQPGVVKLGCNIHDWMAGYIVVVPNAHYAVTGPYGRASVSAPDGRYELAVWSERIKGSGEAPRQPVVLSGRAARPVEVSVKAGPPARPRSRSSQPKYY
jgi:plastocyanin